MIKLIRIIYEQGIYIHYNAMIWSQGHDVCDIMLIDAANEIGSKEADIRSFASVANDGTILFGDEAGSYECMTAQVGPPM